MVDLLPTADQEQLIDAVAGFLSAELSVSRYRADRLEGRLEPALRNEIMQLGWFDSRLPVELGGSGLSIVEDVLIARELGRHLAPMSIFAALVGSRIAASAHDADMAQAIAEGTVRVALAMPAIGANASLESLLVCDGENADVVVGWSEEGCFTLNAQVSEAGERLHGLDGTTSLTLLAVGESGDERTMIGSGQGCNEAILLTAAMLSGVSEAARDMAVGYAKQREQFGQPIGAFQAIKHICADMALRSEAAASQTNLAALMQRDGAEDPAAHVVAAKLLAADAALLNAAGNIQVHGAMGFTAECDAHLFLKRAHLLDQLGGAQGWSRTRLGAHSWGQ